MFGYVTINKSEMSDGEYEIFHRFYCGLCRKLKEKYKKRGQATLTYDMTFLVILLTSLYECETNCVSARCIPNRGRKQEVLINEITEYAADMNLALAYHKCLDNWQDDHSHSQYVIAKLLKEPYEQIKEKYPHKCEVMELELNLLAQLEGKEDTDLDSVANCFGRLTAEIFVYREDEWKQTLWNMGFFLGKFIYFMDAYEDLDKDSKKGSFNPLKSLAKREDFEEFCRQMLVMTMADCSKQFEILPIIENVSILRNVLYSGIWSKYELLRSKKKKGD